MVMVSDSEMTLESPIKISGLILAGGEGRRMSGRDKGLISLAGKPLVAYAINCIESLVDDLAISCNRNKDLYADYQLPCISDNTRNIEMSFAGPMAGLVVGLKQAKHDWLLVMPCDTPLMTKTVMMQLTQAMESSAENDIQAIIFSHQGLQPLHGLYHRSMLPIFETCLAENKNALQRLLRSMDSIKIIEAENSEHNFINVNDQTELQTIERLLASSKVNA